MLAGSSADCQDALLWHRREGMCHDAALPALPGQFWEVLFGVYTEQSTTTGWEGAGSVPGGRRACFPVGGLSAVMC